MEKDIILKIENLYKDFNLEAGFFSKKEKTIYAVNNLSLSLKRGTTYGIVGESGCGKTTTARLIIQMYKATSGNIFFKSKDSETVLDVSSLNKKDLKLYREKVKYIFQDPARSLNPRTNIFDIITAGIRYSSKWIDKKTAYESAVKIIEEVGLSEADLLKRPTEFSGGQRQRISIARGLIMNPELLICDEVVSALDVSVQSQIINLLLELKEKYNITILFISHDLSVVSYISDRVGVMYGGMLMEEAAADKIMTEHCHPYTKLLYSSVVKSSRNSELERAENEVANLVVQVSGCPFANRCPMADNYCRENIPQMKEKSPGHRVACHKV